MLSLKEIQNAMASSILTKKNDDRLLTAIEGGNLTAVDRLQVHQNNFRYTLSSSLMGIFPVIKAFVGADWLEAALKKFVVAHPPVSACLVEYGKFFSDFLMDFEPAQEMPYLTDIASLEWAIHKCQNGIDEESFVFDETDKKDMVQLDNLDLKIIAAHAIVNSSFPLIDLWQLGMGFEPEEEIDLNRGGGIIFLGKINGEVKLFPISNEEKNFFSALAQGQTLRNSVESVSWIFEEGSTKSRILTYINSGFFAGRL